MDPQQKQLYTRDEYVYLANLYAKAGRYNEMLEFICSYIRLNPELTKYESTIFIDGFKMAHEEKLVTWRLIFNTEKREMFRVTEINNSHLLKEVRVKIELELKQIYNCMFKMLNDYILPKLADTDELKIYYLTIKANYYRYITEISLDREYVKFSDLTEKEYLNAWSLAKSLPMHNIIRLSLALHFSVFFYEIKDNRVEAKKLAQFAFDESMKTVGDINKQKVEEIIQTLKVIKENLMLWSIEVEKEDTPENQEFLKRKSQEFSQKFEY